MWILDSRGNKKHRHALHRGAGRRRRSHPSASFRRMTSPGTSLHYSRNGRRALDVGRRARPRFALGIATSQVRDALTLQTACTSFYYDELQGGGGPWVEANGSPASAASALSEYRDGRDTDPAAGRHLQGQVRRR